MIMPFVKVLAYEKYFATLKTASFFAVQLEMFFIRTLLLHLWNKSLILNITKDKRTHDGGNMWWLDN